MALQVWLPLLGTLENLGVSDLEFSVANASYTSTDTNGKIGNCYKNTSNTDGGIVSNKTINLGTNLSMFCWVKLNSFYNSSSLTGILGQHRYPANEGMGITMRYVSSTTGYLSVNTGNGSDRTYNTYYGNTLLSAGTWYHVGFTYDGSKIILYVNGVKDKEVSYSGQKNIADYVQVFCWSFNQTNVTQVLHGNYKLNGFVNDVRIYDHCLSEKEVKEISKALVLHYKLNSGCAVSKNLVNGTITGGTINQGTITVTDGIATINNTSGSWCRTHCQNEAESNTNLANNNVANKTITVSFDILMISGNVPTIFISDSYRAVTGVDKTQIGVWQRGYCTYVHPGYSSSYNYFSPHFSSVGNYQIKDIKIVLGDIKDYYSSYNEGNIVYDSSGYGRHGTFTNALGDSNESPKYNNGVLSEDSVITCTNFSLPDGPTTISFWNKPSVSATENTSRMTVRFGKFEYFTYLNYPYFIHDTDYRYKYTNYWLDGNWHFVSCVYDGTNAMIYIDGEQLSLSVTATTHDYQNNLVITPIGESVSDFRVYSTALSPDDVKELYHTAASVDNHGNFFCGELKEV